MWPSALLHLPWYQLVVAPIPAVTSLTLAALDTCTVRQEVVYKPVSTVTTPVS